MTSKTITTTKTAGDFEPFPEYPPRDDMQNWNYLYSRGQAAGLKIHLGEQETTTVGCEIPLGQTPGMGRGVRIPDLMVSWNSRPDLVLEHRGYAIDRQGKPPDFVLEVASVTTGEVDYTDKRVDYARYGVPEYWRFDPTGGEYHDTSLAGDRLVGDEYEPIAIERVDESRYRGYSEALGLYVCWEYGELRFYDVGSGSYVRTHYDEAERAEAEAARAEREAERAEAEAARAEREAEARREAEAEVLRLRARLAELSDIE